MFGGLQIKGATASKHSDDEPDPDPEPSVPDSASIGVSSFGFMNVGPPEPIPAAPSPAISSFTFLNSAVPDPVPATQPSPPTATPTAASSAFSFMMQESTTTATNYTAENPDVAASPSAPSSGFDFMNSLATPAAADAATPAAVVEETIIPTIAEESPAAVTLGVTSGFSFLSENPPMTPLDGSLAAVQPAMPTTIHTRTNSVSSISSSLSAPSSAPNPIPAITGGLINGAGVTFGTSSAKPRIKKKKTRVSRVGVGANHNDALTTATALAPAPVVPSPVVAVDENKSSHDAALESANRAEAFMQAKAMEEARSSTAISSSAAVSKTESITDLGFDPTESTDDVLAAAQVAAEKAKMLQHQQKGKGGGFMGTFFKGFRASPNTTSVNSSGTMANSSKHSVGSQSVGSSSSGNAMDRLAKEQHAMKQAMAKRQLEQQQQQKSEQLTVNQNEDEDDDEVVVTISAGVCRTATVQPMEYSSVTAGADAITKTTISEGSTFVPVALAPSSTQKSSFSFEVPSYGEVHRVIKTPVEPNERMNNTPKQIFERHQGYFSESVNRAMKKVEDTRCLKKGLLEERLVALAKDRFATREIEQIEELQQGAIDEEDYELADELGQKLDAYKREKSEVAKMLANNKNSLEKLESENTSLGDLIVSCFDDLALRLDDLKQKEVASEKKDDNEILTQYANISKQLSAEHERLQQDFKHLERDEQLVGEERKELEESIKDQTGEIETQKEEASTKLADVEKEIEELRNALQIKQKEAAVLRTNMFGFEDSISKVRVKFSRQLTRVDKKEISLKESRREWEIENEQHKIQKDAHDLQVRTHSDTLLAHEELMKSLEFELQLSKQFSQIMPTQLGFMEEDSEAEEEDGDDEGSLAQLKANVVKCEGAIDVAKKKLKMASIAIQNLQNERDVLIARIPDLETQKKAAASGRDFKAAGKFSKEIKDANARIKGCEDELNVDFKAIKAQAEENLRQLDFEFLEAKKVADTKEKLSGKKRMEVLAKKIAQLVEEVTEKCGDSKSGGKCVKSVAARVLEGQIIILKSEGHEIGSKYGGWDELMGSIGLDDGESTSSMKESSENLNILAVDKARQEDFQNKIGGGGLSSEERLAKAKELLAKSSEVETKVEEAAGREDFEAAGELQETLDKINVEIEEMNITDEECELLAEIDTALDTDPHEPQQQDQCGPTSEEGLLKAKELMTKRTELEQRMLEAAEIEDYETAEELQTSLDQIFAELNELNITDEQRESLTMEGASSDIISPLQEDTKALTGVEEEEKKGGDEENASDLDNEKFGNDDETSAEMESTDEFKNKDDVSRDDES